MQSATIGIDPRQKPAPGVRRERVWPGGAEKKVQRDQLQPFFPGLEPCLIAKKAAGHPSPGSRASSTGIHAEAHGRVVRETECEVRKNRTWRVRKSCARRSHTTACASCRQGVEIDRHDPQATKSTIALPGRRDGTLQGRRRPSGPGLPPCREENARRCLRRISAPLPGAAGQLLYVLAEGLRCELQSFDHRQVREQLVGEFLHRHVVMNRQRRRLYQFARFRGD